jgi:hypothetical protein
MVRLLCRGCGLQTAHCKPADQHRQLASAIGRQLPPGHLLARLARAHDEPRSSARAPVAPRCRAAAASSTGMTLQGFRWGWLENRIKECQGDLFADRTSAATMRANQLRLWFASLAYVLLCALRSAAHRPPPHPVCRGHLRHAAPRAAEDRSPGPPIGPPHQRRYGLSASLSGRVRFGPCPIDRRPGLTNQTAQADIHRNQRRTHVALAAYGLSRSELGGRYSTIPRCPHQ